MLKVDKHRAFIGLHCCISEELCIFSRESKAVATQVIFRSDFLLLNDVKVYITPECCYENTQNLNIYS